MARPPKTTTSTAPNPEQVLHAAKGLCQCTGQCGATHNWTAAATPRRCRAPHACGIVRKRDYPSFWQLASNELSGPLAHPEHYNLDKPVLVEVKPAVVADGSVIGACQRCKLLIDRGQADG